MQFIIQSLDAAFTFLPFLRHTRAKLVVVENFTKMVCQAFITITINILFFYSLL